jgi:multiple sugar transport system permease protein
MRFIAQGSVNMTSSKLRQIAVPYLFIAPFFVIFLIFEVLPLGYALQLSLFRETLVGGARFVGFENFVRVAQDARFWNGVVTMLRYGVFLVPALIVIALTLALLIDSRVPLATKAFRVIFFIPYAIPGVIAAIIWGYLYGPSFGPIAQALRGLGLPAAPILEPEWVLFSIANIVIWELMGYKMIIVYAALKSIPVELEEAADLDGATATQFAWHVKIPLVVGAILLNAIFSIIGTLQLFNEPAILRANAPGVISSTFTPNMYAYSLAFTSQDLGYAAAVSFVLAAIVALLSGIIVFGVWLRGRRR